MPTQQLPDERNHEKYRETQCKNDSEASEVMLRHRMR